MTRMNQFLYGNILHCKKLSITHRTLIQLVISLFSASFSVLNVSKAFSKSSTFSPVFADGVLSICGATLIQLLAPVKTDIQHPITNSPLDMDTKTQPHLTEPFPSEFSSSPKSDSLICSAQIHRNLSTFHLSKGAGFNALLRFKLFYKSF